MGIKINLFDSSNAYLGYVTQEGKDYIIYDASGKLIAKIPKMSRLTVSRAIRILINAKTIYNS